MQRYSILPLCSITIVSHLWKIKSFEMDVWAVQGYSHDTQDAMRYSGAHFKRMCIFNVNFLWPCAIRMIRQHWNYVESFLEWLNNNYRCESSFLQTRFWAIRLKLNLVRYSNKWMQTLYRSFRVREKRALTCSPSHRLQLWIRLHMLPICSSTIHGTSMKFN